MNFEQNTSTILLKTQFYWKAKLCMSFLENMQASRNKGALFLNHTGHFGTTSITKDRV